MRTLRNRYRSLEGPMNSRQLLPNSHVLCKRTAVAGFVVLTSMLMTAEPVFGQVRTKKPDRESYQSPILEPVEVEWIGEEAERIGASEKQSDGKLRQVNHTLPRLVKPPAQVAAIPTPPADETDIQQSGGWSDETVTWDDAPVLHDATCDGCDACDGGCDSHGCDSMGPSGWPGASKWANSSLSFDKSRWFGSIELLLMFGKGDRLPPLVTTGPLTIPNPENPPIPSEIPNPNVEILYGGRVLHDLRAGGRLTLGTWVDPHCCRSLVFRGWFAGEETDSFGSNQSINPVITRPFLNVTDDPIGVGDTQIIAFPDRASGSISVNTSSEVYGADLSARQKWFSRFGGTVDLLYGYQFMRVDEDLNISSTSISEDDAFAPLGSVLAIDDSFDAENEFHGGQFGLASRYREGCWSFHSLAKVGFGVVRRSANLRGETFTSIDGNNAIDPNGLLVRSTNAGSTEDHTFGWVPELDFSLGWHQYPRFDLTFGYNIIAMTDAIQVSGLIDPELAVNLSDPLVGRQSPQLRVRDHTYYVQGIHFGLQYVY